MDHIIWIILYGPYYMDHIIWTILYGSYYIIWTIYRDSTLVGSKLYSYEFLKVGILEFRLYHQIRNKKSCFNFAKSIFPRNPPVTWPQFFDFWLIFYCKSDDIIEIPKSKCWILNAEIMHFNICKLQLKYCILMCIRTKVGYV